LNIEQALFRVLDTETTGLDTETAKIVEVGACDVYATTPIDALKETRWTQSQAESWLCNPGIPIPPDAKAVHHIIEADLQWAPPASSVIAGLMPSVPVAESAVVFVAHNVNYDRPILEREGMPKGARWLCTHRLAMHVWPDAPSYKNEVLRYWLGYDILPWQPNREATRPHRASHDVAVTALILQTALLKLRPMGYDDVDALVRWAESPVVLKGQLGFGKYFDKTWAEVAQLDGGYFDWMIRQEDREPGSWDMDKIHTARHYRGRLV
jgi:exodeoxyribonuclease X